MGCCFGREDSESGKFSASNEENLPFLNHKHSRSSSPLSNTGLQVSVKCRLFDDPNPGECPMCGEPGADKSNMIVCDSPVISYEIFQKLMVRGWWRTGNIFFTPRVDEICCPSYAIRMKAVDYQLTKKHKRVLNTWNNFLIYGDQRWENRKQKRAESAVIVEVTPIIDNNSNPSVLPTSMLCISRDISITADDHDLLSCTDDDEKKVTNKGQRQPVRKGAGPDPNKPPCRKAKDIRAERRRMRKSFSKQDNAVSGQSLPSKKESLLEMIEKNKIDLESHRDSCKHKLEVKLIRNDSPEMISTLQEFYDLYVRFQEAVHPGHSRFMGPDVLHWGFIESPLEPQENSQGQLGTYHMRYYLDGELIMVSVMDILPEYLVSIYFIYDPDIRFLQPGIYTCLREIQLILELQQSQPELQYYNLGFYNDFSPKISYKRQFKPTEILCPITNTYVPLEDAIPLLKQNRYCKLAKDDVAESLAVPDHVLDDMLICPSSEGIYHRYCQLSSGWRVLIKPVLRRYLQRMGGDVMKEMLLTL